MLIVKVLSFVIILCVIKFMAGKIQSSKDNITELGEILIDRKNFSKVYFVLVIAFTIIFTIALSLPNDLDKSTYQMVTGILIGSLKNKKVAQSVFEKLTFEIVDE